MDNRSAYSYQWGLHARPTPGEGEWIALARRTDFDPNPRGEIFEGGRYANRGTPRRVSLGVDEYLRFRLQLTTTDNGDLPPAIALLLDAADQGTVIEYRYRHLIAPIDYAGTALVEWTRSNIGPAGAEFLVFSLTGQGDRRRTDE
ncbi:hypothetical protein [Microbacterium excoecariae]|uniref:hypothetical protein n=1 Tax=Microbacterium excoecariae TaxID=2715210 RepID=UPI00140CF9BF|nr:hypothetical protein [Microbacterium excoecariae]NHI16869.1 hypothetical protein [Microbacterium excoecariae]